MSGGSALGLNKPAPSPTRRGGRKRTVSTQSGTHLRMRAPPHGHRRPPSASAGEVLGQYTDRLGSSREIVARSGAGGSALVIDRDAATFGDGRLVAHLAPDEPAESPSLMCDQYLADARRRCGRVTSADLETIPDPQDDRQGHNQGEAPDSNLLVDRHGRSYNLEPVLGSLSIPEIRWQQYPP
jgi:hypothetical protein